MNLREFYLAAHRRQLQRMKSTVRPGANVQTSNADSWQRQTLYPLTGELLVSYTITSGKSGTFTGLSLNNGAAPGALRYVVLLNGYPLRGLQNPIYVQVGVNQPQGVSYFLPENSTISVLCQTLGGGAPAGNPVATITGFEWYGGLGSYDKEPEEDAGGRQPGAQQNQFAPGWRTGAPAGTATNGGRYPFGNQ